MFIMRSQNHHLTPSLVSESPVGVTNDNSSVCCVRVWQGNYVVLLQIKSLQALINMNMQRKVKCKIFRLHDYNESRHDVMMTRVRV